MLTKSAERRRPTASLTERSRRTIVLLIASQLCVVLAIAAALGATAGFASAYSALVGGLIGVIPNYHFAGRLARRRRGATAEETLRRIYVGEFIKIAFTAALFVIAIRLLKIEFLVVVLTYFATVVVNWLAFLVADLGEVPRALSRSTDRAQLHGK